MDRNFSSRQSDGTGLQRGDALVLLALALLGVAIALVLGDDYGMSWDERDTSVAGQAALDAYGSGLAPFRFFKNSQYYGPAYMAFAELAAKPLAHQFSGWTVIDGRHATYFLSFLLSILSIYVIARGLVPMKAALAATLLFATQPLLFGHGFINPKDSPFAGLFAASLALGILTHRAIPESVLRWSVLGPQLQKSVRAGWVSFSNFWHKLRPRFRLLFLFGTFTAALFVLDMLLTKQIILPSLLRLTEMAYKGEAPFPFQAIFSRVAARALELPLSDYLHKTTGIYGQAQIALLITTIVVPAIASYAYLLSRSRRLGAAFFAYLLAGAAFLGLSTSIRVAGPMAGILISVLLIWRLRLWALPSLILYWILAGVIMYATWPYLWQDPVANFQESLGTMAQFPWESPVLFMGASTLAEQLPWFFAPAHISLQLTLPAILLGLSGVTVAIISKPRNSRLAEVTLLVVWLVVPFAAVILVDATIYDGARQLLFAVAPLFILGGFSLAKILTLVRRPLATVMVVFALLVPGVAGIISLHPYEYVYYNELAGGVRNAFREYELDYWATGFREAMEYLAETAPQGSTVGVAGPWQSAFIYSRPDLERWKRNPEISNDHPDFLIASTRTNLDMDVDHWPDVAPSWVLERDGAILVLVRDLRGIQ